MVFEINCKYAYFDGVNNMSLCTCSLVVVVVIIVGPTEWTQPFNCTHLQLHKNGNGKAVGNEKENDE